MQSIDTLLPLFNTAARRSAMETLTGKEGPRRARLTGLAGSSAAMLLAAMKKGKHPVLVVADDFDTAAYMYHDLSRLADNEEEVKIFPSGYRRHIKYGQVDAPNQILRTDALNSRDNGVTRWIVTCPEALAEKVPASGELKANTLTLAKGDIIQMSEVTRRLGEMGFHRVDYVYEPGQFAMRGSILDVFSYSNELPYRIDFFDDEIDSIRNFDVETQLSSDKPEKVSIIPDIADSESGDSTSLLNLLSPDTLVFCQSAENLTARVREIAKSTIAPEVEISGEGDKDAMKRVVDADDFERRLQGFRIMEYSAGKASPQTDIAGLPVEASLDFNTEPQALYHKNFDLISQSFEKFLSEGYRIFILSDNPKQIERLRAIFDDRGDRFDFSSVDIRLLITRA